MFCWFFPIFFLFRTYPSIFPLSANQPLKFQLCHILLRLSLNYTEHWPQSVKRPKVLMYNDWVFIMRLVILWNSLQLIRRNPLTLIRVIYNLQHCLWMYCVLYETEISLQPVLSACYPKSLHEHRAFNMIRLLSLLSSHGNKLQLTN
jgi:hypothetical protein